MTEKLYYRDPFLMDFTAAVLSCEMVTDAYRVVLPAFWTAAAQAASMSGMCGRGTGRSSISVIGPSLWGRK